MHELITFCITNAFISYYYFLIIWLRLMRLFFSYHFCPGWVLSEETFLGIFWQTINQPSCSNYSKIMSRDMGVAWHCVVFMNARVLFFWLSQMNIEKARNINVWRSKVLGISIDDCHPSFFLAQGNSWSLTFDASICSIFFHCHIICELLWYYLEMCADFQLTFFYFWYVIS